MAVGRIVAGTLAALVLPASLAACGGDSSVADPPVAPSPSSPTTSDPPAHETAEHFIRRWAEAEKRMENTGKTAAYSNMSKGCEACSTLVALVSRYYNNGGYIRWDGWKILDIHRYPASRGIAFAVHADSAPTRFKASANATSQRLAGGSITYVLDLVSSGDTFSVKSKAQLDQ